MTILLVAVLTGFHAALAANADFAAGADFSLLAFYESRGVTYKENGQPTDGLQILKDHGLNCVRLRLFTSSAAQAAADPYNYINNLSYTLPLAVRVKQAGLRFLLDFHYSDTWADPGHQAAPSAWTNFTFSEVVQQMNSYSSNTIAAFAAAGAMPDYVQVGNEISSGMVWPYGRVSGNGGTNWYQLGQLMTAAIQGIKGAATTAGQPVPQIIVHIDRGGDWNTTMWFFDNLIAQGVPFDIIGESYYTFFQGSPASLSNCLNNAAARYGKPIMVAEHAFPWTNACPPSWRNSLFGYPPTPDGQVSFVATLAGIVGSLTNHLGAGFFYWGAEYQALNGVNEAGYNTSSFFDFNGNALPVADAVGGMAAPAWINASLSGTNLVVHWPLSGAGSTLMNTTNPSSPNSWLPAAAVVVAGTNFSATLPIGSNSMFYRLQPR